MLDKNQEIAQIVKKETKKKNSSPYVNEALKTNQ